MGARTENLRHLALDKLARPRLLHLVANGDLASGAEQAADVGVRRVKRNAAHGNHAAFGQRHIQQLRPQLGVLEEQLIEISQPEKQQGILGQLALDAAILRHHGSQLGVAGHQSRLVRKRSQIEIKKENSEAIAQGDRRSRKRDHCHLRQVLTPRTKISNPVLGLRAYCLATIFLLLGRAFFNYFQTKLIHRTFTGFSPF